ncbi:hypothetical protein PSYPI_28219 [Pseudomonas syringae pv. pisi str. 1704B]|uniref:Uncharacterized protein n=1 Tax=Pseudomonas syringae pv. pisi str. 1704B TaxID=629263 RepID=F3GFZ7_PSESJ|nr:hypothetical protein PSYPI_28219 [Pseudomonas syringae pv. pisi str. 1704B]
MLDDLIALTQPGQITVHLPKEVENEFKRDRESKLQAAISEFNNAKLSGITKPLHTSLEYKIVMTGVGGERPLASSARSFSASSA